MNTFTIKHYFNHESHAKIYFVYYDKRTDVIRNSSLHIKR